MLMFLDFVPFKKRPALRRAGAKNDPVNTGRGLRFNEAQNSSSTTDLDVVGVRAKAKDLKWPLAEICQANIDHGKRVILSSIGRSIEDRNRRLLAWSRIFPDFPRGVTMSVHVVQLLLVLKSVHGCVKAI